MFKKVVLSSLLSVTMVFSMGLGVGAEALETAEERFCRNLYYDEIKGLIKEKDAKIRKIEEKMKKIDDFKNDLINDLKKVVGLLKNDTKSFPSNWSDEKIERFLNANVEYGMKILNEKLYLLGQKEKNCKSAIKRLLKIYDEFCPGSRDKIGEEDFSEKVFGWKMDRIVNDAEEQR